MTASDADSAAAAVGSRDDGQLRHPAAGAGQRRRRRGHRRRRQDLPRPARRHRGQRPRPPPPRGHRGRHPADVTRWATPRTCMPPSRASRWPKRWSACSGGRRTRRGCSSATPAPRPTRSAFKMTRLTGRTQTRCRQEALPRPDHGLAGADRPADQAGAVRAAARRRHPRAVRRRRRAGRRGRRRHRRGVPGADHGGGRRRRAARRATSSRPARSPPARRAAGARRGADRDRPHRSVFRPPARRHHARTW